MAVTTAHDFLQLVEKSRLLSPEQMAQVRTWPEHEPRPLAARLVSEGWITRWQSEMLLAGKYQFFLGKYKLLDLLGIGGMGRVFKAVAVLPVVGRVVALKVMNKAVLKQPKALKRFLREIQSAAAIDHPNIVHAYDANREGDIYFLVMEFVPGRNLKAWIQKEGSLPIAWSCECIRQAALGLQHAFELGMVHRDIKPSNLLVSQNDGDGTPFVKILDFGLARFASETRDEGELTRSGQVLGTPDYIAPEQASNTRSADIRADIFSLGCALFEMLTGRLPFGGDTVMEKLMARATQDALPIRSLRPDVPPELEAVVARMLQRNPQARYATPAEVAWALAPFATGTGGMAHGVSAGMSAPAAAAPETSPNADFPTFDFLEPGAFEGLVEEATCVPSAAETGRETTPFQTLWRQRRVRLAAGAFGTLLAVLVVVGLLSRSTHPGLTESSTEGHHKKKHIPVAGGEKGHAAVSENDPERATARRLLELGGQLAITPSPRHGEHATSAGSTAGTSASGVREIHQMQDLPKTGFRITAVDLHGRSLDASDLTLLAGLAHIQTLNLAGSGVSDQALENVRKLTTLEHLDLSDTGITDSGVARLKELEGLKSLRLARTRVTGGALEHLKASQNLTELSLAEDKIVDSDLRYVGSMTQLQVLNLDHTRVRGQGLRFLRPLKELTWLDLGGLPMQGPAFAHLGNLESLHYLRLTGAKVKDDDLGRLSALTRLHEIHLGSTSIAGPGLKSLTWMADLERLDLERTVVGDAGLKFVSELTSLRALNLHGTAISDKGLDVLRSLQRLEELDVAETKASLQGVDSLRQALPGCKIEF